MKRDNGSRSSASSSEDSAVYYKDGRRVVHQLRTGRVYVDGKQRYKVDDDLKYEVFYPDLERCEANCQVAKLMDLVYRLRIAGDMLYTAKKEDWPLPKHFDYARGVLREAEAVSGQWEEEGLIVDTEFV